MYVNGVDKMVNNGAHLSSRVQRLVESMPRLRNTILQKDIPSFVVLMIIVESAV